MDAVVALDAADEQDPRLAVTGTLSRKLIAHIAGTDVYDVFSRLRGAEVYAGLFQNCMANRVDILRPLHRRRFECDHVPDERGVRVRAAEFGDRFHRRLQREYGRPAIVELRDSSFAKPNRPRHDVQTVEVVDSADFVVHVGDVRVIVAKWHRPQVVAFRCGVGQSVHPDAVFEVHRVLAALGMRDDVNLVALCGKTLREIAHEPADAAATRWVFAGHEADFQPATGGR